MQRERRRDPYPWTWEPPAATLIGLTLAMLAGVHIGRGLANLVVGAGWTWPAGATSQGYPSPFGAAFWSSIPGVLGGDAAAGLAKPARADVAGPKLLWFSTFVTEAAVLAAVGWLIAVVYQRFGAGCMRGMATAREAEKLLGITRLRRSAPITRPDLHGKQITVTDRVQRVAGVPGEQTGPELGRGLSPWLLDRRGLKEER